MWAALLHDIGKPKSTKVRNGKITSYNHEKIGAEMAAEFLSEFTDDPLLIRDVCALVRWHMQILFVMRNLSFQEIGKMKQQADPYEVSLLGFCDRMGRTGASRREEEENRRLFMQKCGISPEDKTGFSGSAL